MAKRHTTRRGLSAGAALVTGLGTIGMGLFAAAPAQADVTGTLNYTCSVEVFGNTTNFEDPWKVDLTIGAPEQVEPGATIPAPSITASVTPGPDAADTMKALAGQNIQGTADTAYAVGGEERTAKLTIEKVQVPDTGVVTTVATGTGQEETAPSKPGEIPITAGDFTAELVTDSGFVVPVSCAAPEDNAVGSIQVGEGGGEEPAPEEDDWFDEPSSLPLVDNVFTVEGKATHAGVLNIQVLDGEHKPLKTYTWNVSEGENSKDFSLVEGADYVRVISEDCVDSQGRDETVDGDCNVIYKAPWADDDGNTGGDNGDGDDNTGGDNGDGDDNTGGDNGDGDDNTGGDNGDGDDNTGGEDQGQDQGGDDAGDGDDQGQDQGGDDAGDGDDQGQDQGGDDQGQPEVPDVVQTDGGSMKDEGATNTALGLGGLLLIGAGAGAVFAARRRAEQL